MLLEHHLEELRLPTMLREYDHMARQCAVEQVDYQRYLVRLTELELLDANAAPLIAASAGEVPRRQDAGQLRLPRYALGEQNTRARTSPL